MNDKRLLTLSSRAIRIIKLYELQDVYPDYLSEMLGITIDDAREVIRKLEEIGFLKIVDEAS